MGSIDKLLSYGGKAGERQNTSLRGVEMGLRRHLIIIVRLIGFDGFLSLF
jgi:hypothetical protein